MINQANDQFSESIKSGKITSKCAKDQYDDWKIFILRYYGDLLLIERDLEKIWSIFQYLDFYHALCLSKVSLLNIDFHNPFSSDVNISRNSN